MPLTEQKRQQTMHSVSLKLQQMLPNYAAQERQTLLEQLDRDALTAANGDEDAYINRMAAKLSNIQRKLTKAQGQAAPAVPAVPQQPARPSGSGATGRPDISRMGSDHSSGSARNFNSQHRHLMAQHQQMLMGAKQAPPAQQMMPPGVARQAQSMQQHSYMPQHPQVPQTPWGTQQQPSQMQRYPPQQHQRPMSLQGQQPRGPFAAAPSHMQPGPRQQPREYDPHQAAWQAAAQRQPQAQLRSQAQPRPQPQAHQSQLRKPANSSEFGLLTASPSMEQMVYGLILTNEQQHQHPQLQYQPGPRAAAHQQSGYAQRPAAGPMQGQGLGGRPSQFGTVPMSQPPPPVAQPRQPGGFMDLLTSEAPQQAPAWRGGPQQARPEQPQKLQPGYASAATALPNRGVARPAALPEPAHPAPQSGLDDFTEQYWALMSKIQADIVPSLELLKPRFSNAASKPEHPDWERLRSKMGEILKLLPRLKIQRTDPRYVGRMWTRHEYESMLKIERQLGPYCDRFFPKGRPGSSSVPSSPATQQSSASNTKPPSPAMQPPSGLTYLSQDSPASQSNAQVVIEQPAAQPVKLEAQPSPAEASKPAEEKPAQPAPAKPEVSDKRQQLLQAAGGYQATECGGPAGIERLFAHQAADSPLPPPHLLPPGFLLQDAGQAVSKNVFQAVSEGFSTSEPGGSPSSVLDGIDGRAPKRAKVLDEASAANFARRKALLEAECAEVAAGLGQGMQLQIGPEPASTDGTLLVHVRPAAEAGKPRLREWQILTLRVGPAYPAAPPQLTQPGSVSDAGDFFKAEAAWDMLVESLAPCQPLLRVEVAARAWQAALTAVANDKQLF